MNSPQRPTQKVVVESFTSMFCEISISTFSVDQHLALRIRKNPESHPYEHPVGPGDTSLARSNNGGPHLRGLRSFDVNWTIVLDGRCRSAPC